MKDFQGNKIRQFRLYTYLLGGKNVLTIKMSENSHNGETDLLWRGSRTYSTEQNFDIHSNRITLGSYFYSENEYFVNIHIAINRKLYFNKKFLKIIFVHLYWIPTLLIPNQTELSCGKSENYNTIYIIIFLIWKFYSTKKNAIKIK